MEGILKGTLEGKNFGSKKFWKEGRKKFWKEVFGRNFRSEEFCKEEILEGSFWKGEILEGSKEVRKKFWKEERKEFWKERNERGEMNIRLNIFVKSTNLFHNVMSGTHTFSFSTVMDFIPPKSRGFHFK